MTKAVDGSGLRAFGSEVKKALSGKQDRLTAGTNVTISDSGTIGASAPAIEVPTDDEIGTIFDGAMEG